MSSLHDSSRRSSSAHCPICNCQRSGPEGLSVDHFVQMFRATQNRIVSPEKVLICWSILYICDAIPSTTTLTSCDWSRRQQNKFAAAQIVSFQICRHLRTANPDKRGPRMEKCCVCKRSLLGNGSQFPSLLTLNRWPVWHQLMFTTPATQSIICVIMFRQIIVATFDSLE